jgi:hypothetical protein
MLGKILADTIEPEPVGSDRQRVQVPGNLSLEKLIAREAMNSTMVAPTGGVRKPERTLSPVTSCVTGLVEREQEWRRCEFSSGPISRLQSRRFGRTSWSVM